MAIVTSTLRPQRVKEHVCQVGSTDASKHLGIVLWTLHRGHHFSKDWPLTRELPLISICCEEAVLLPGVVHLVTGTPYIEIFCNNLKYQNAAKSQFTEFTTHTCKGWYLLCIAKLVQSS